MRNTETEPLSRPARRPPSAHRVLALAMLALLPLAAGCATPPPTDDGPADGANGKDGGGGQTGGAGLPTSDVYMLTALGVPEVVAPGESFAFTLDVDGPGGWTSDHIGAHYGPDTSTEPSVAIYPAACEHQESDLPGRFTVTCTIDEEGAHYLRGHARISSGDKHVNYWSSEHTITVEAAPAPRPAYELTLDSVPTSASVGEAFSFNLTIAGDEQSTSDHIGAHYGSNATDEPRLAAYPAACDHQPGDVPGSFVVTCTIDEEGEHHLRGHLRLSIEGEQVHYWSHEVVVTVQAASAA